MIFILRNFQIKFVFNVLKTKLTLKMKEIIIGIDLGTSNCCVSFIGEDGKIQILTDPSFPSNPTIPSIVSIESEGVLVGNEINKSHINSNKNIFHNFKRLIGHKLGDLETTNLKQILNYTIIESNDKILCQDLNGKTYHLEEIIYLLLNKIKSIIVTKFGDYGWSCIVTIPAYFNELQRQITLSAIQLANLPLIKLLNEPTAASFAYLYHNKILYEETFNKKILVIDFGAGTLDLTIIDITKAKDDDLVCEVLGIYGDNNFGGIDITRLVYSTLFDSDISLNSIDINTKLTIADDIKIQLSNELDVKYYSNELDKTFIYKYKKFFSQLKKTFSEKMIWTIEQVLGAAKLDKESIDEIILVGGSFKIPYFRTLVSEWFNKQIDKISLKIDNQTFLLYEDIAVSLGAAAYGYYNSRDDGIVLIEKLPLSIGIEDGEGMVVKILERNTPIPITKTKTFTTEDPEQKSVDICIYQGESSFKSNCSFIGKFSLVNLPPNKPVIFVSVRVDSNGIISITARDKRGWAESSICIEASDSKLTEEQINELIEKYQSNKSNETQYKNLVANYYQLINFIDKISYQINFNLELKLEDSVIAIIRSDLEKVLNALSNPYVVSRYRINTNLLIKCAIINEIEYKPHVYDESFKMDSVEIDQYIEMLIKLKEFLIDKYDIFIIQDSSQVLAQNQTKKLETLDDTDASKPLTDDAEIVNYKEVFDDINLKKKTECSSIANLKNLLNSIDPTTHSNPTVESDELDSSLNQVPTYTKSDLDELVEYLRSNIKDFELTAYGENYLLKQINSIGNNNNLDENSKITQINELCLYVKENYSE